MDEWENYHLYKVQTTIENKFGISITKLTGGSS